MTLLHDPYTLPHTRPVLLSSFLRMQLQKHLKKIIRNKELNELYRVANSYAQSSIEECILTMKPFNARIASLAYSCSPKGYVEQIVRQFDSGRSIQDALLIKSGKGRVNRILVRTIRQEKKCQVWRRSKLVGKRYPGEETIDIDSINCSALQAQTIRDYIYGVTIQGVTMPCLQHLISFHNPEESLEDDNIFMNHFTIKVLPVTKKIGTDSSRLFSTSGKIPFIGFKTRAGTTEPFIKSIEDDAILIKIKSRHCSSLDLGAMILSK